MRTTLDLESDALQLAKQLAKQQGKTTGQMVSLLIFKALEAKPAPKSRNGVPLLPPRPGAKPVSLEHIKELMHEE